MKRLGFTATALSVGIGLADLLLLGAGLSAARAQGVEATTFDAPPGANIGAIGATEITTTAIVAGGELHTCALTSGGGLKCWGNNGSGRLGDNSTDERHTPVDVYGLLSGVKAVDGGYYHTCAVMTNGRVKCWGSNSKGQLGDDQDSGTYSHKPVYVKNYDDTLLSDAIAVSTGERHSCALTSGGGVKCWGYNFPGCLGDNSINDRHKAVVVTTNGGVKCWGLNTHGQLGNDKAAGTETRSMTPVDVTGLSSGVATISAGHDHTCAVLANGTAKCWGGNNSGQLGNDPPATDWVSHDTPVAVESLSNAAAVAAGREHTCALLNDGSMKCWGYNAYGQLGKGSTGGSRETNYLAASVSGIGSGSSTAAIAAGNNHSCAAFSDWSVKCWGYNSNGQLGDNSTDNRNTPVNVDGLPYVPPAYSISGWVADGHSFPISDTTITADGTVASLTDSNGDYTLTGLLTGTYTLTPTKNGYSFTPVTRTVTVPPDAHDVNFFAPVRWTLMVYLDADNNLDDVGWINFNDLESAADNGNVNILVVWDRINTESAYYEVQYDTDPDQAVNYTENVNAWLKGELNMGDPETLIDFVNWARSKYPAQHYALVLDDHGGGLAGAMQDETDGSDIITVSQLGAALSAVTITGTNKIDVLYMFACLMGMIEDAYQFRGYADYYVASEHISWAWRDGNLYKKYVDGITATTTAEQLAKAFTTKYGEICESDSVQCTMSTADMSHLSTVVTATNTLGQALNDGMATHATTLESVGHAVQRFDMNSDDAITSTDEYVDLYDFAFLVDSVISDATIQAAAQDVMNAVDDLIIANYTRSTDDFDLDNSHGVSIFWPDTSSSFYTAANYAFAAGATWTTGVGQALVSDQATMAWGPMLVNYFQTTDPGGPDNPTPPEAIAPHQEGGQEGGAVNLPIVLKP